MPLFMYELYLRGFRPKGLAHPGHWAGPLGTFFEKFGAVKAGWGAGTGFLLGGFL
jgi:hypothetical protein